MAFNHNPGRVYDLSYVPGKGRKGNRTPPELVVSVASEHMTYVDQALIDQEFLSRFPVEQYLCESAEFVMPDRRQLGFAWSAAERRGFGFGECGYLTEDEDHVRFHLPLVRERQQHTALTIHTLLVPLTKTLYKVAEHTRGANRTQLIQINAGWVPDRVQWQHPMGGYVYPEFRQLLHRKAQQLFEGKPEAKGAYLSAAINRSMEEAYRALGDPEHADLWKGESFCALKPDGRFTLVCPGNACDVSLYPEEDLGPECDMPSQFGCHNLDSATQQLTLLVGLALLLMEVQKDTR